MSFYWLLILIVLASFSAIAFCAKYAVDLKHQYDEDYKPAHFINEVEVLVIGAVGGSLGLLISYLAFKQLREEDRFHHRRFILLTVLFLAIHIALLASLGYYGYLFFDGFF